MSVHAMGSHRGRNTALIVAGALVIALASAAGVLVLQRNPSTAQALAEVGHVLPASRPYVLVPQGTPVVVRLESTLSTKTTRVGDRFTSVVSTPVMVGEKTAIPAGTRVWGRVVMAEEPGKASGRGHLQLAFDTMTINGQSYQLGSRSAVFQSASGTKKDAALIGGGAVAGGILGGLLGHGAGGVAKGAIIGGAAGTATSLMTRGPQLELGSGTRIRFTLDQAVEVPEATAS